MNGRLDPTANAGGRSAHPTTRCAGTLLVGLALVVAAGCATRGKAPAGGATAARSEQRFPTPAAAVDALLAACRANDETALLAIFGPEAKALVSTGDPAADRERCARLVTAAQQMTRLDPKGADAQELVVGTDDWPFPIPLVKDGREWHFDTVQGEQEVVRRRIGADELEAIAVCRAYVRAQERYASRPRDGGKKAYAQKFVSSPGKRDGLYWPAGKRGDESPLGSMVASAGEHASAEASGGSWWGYRFRILTAQGQNAPGGTRSYLVDGRMVGGFALVAYPAAYGSTGIMTFIVDKDGRVHEKDLGAQTAQVAAAMTAYDPDGSWRVVGQ